jgi:hypothetical protein
MRTTLTTTLALLLALVTPAFGQTFTESLTITVTFPDGSSFTKSQGGSAGPAYPAATVSTPELPLLRRALSRHIGGRPLKAIADPPLQHITAWGASGVLRAAQIPAVSDGVLVHLSRVRLEVEEWCSGLVSMKWLSLLAGTWRWWFRTSGSAGAWRSCWWRR